MFDLITIIIVTMIISSLVISIVTGYHAMLCREADREDFLRGVQRW